MSYSSINRNFLHLLISFCTILLFVNSCALIEPEKISVSRDILRQYVGSYQMGHVGYQIGPDPIARVTLEGNQLFVSSCPFLGLSISRDVVKWDVDSVQDVSELTDHDFKKIVQKRVQSEIKMMSRTMANKKYPIYAKSEAVFATKNKIPARIEFFKNGKGEVTHFIVKKNLLYRQPPSKNKEEESNLELNFMGTGKKIQPYINNEHRTPYKNSKYI